MLPLRKKDNFSEYEVQPYNQEVVTDPRGRATRNRVKNFRAVVGRF